MLAIACHNHLLTLYRRPKGEGYVTHGMETVSSDTVHHDTHLC